MSSSTENQARRLSGSQITVIALAACLALILAPAGVYAAAAQKVKVVGTVETNVKGVVQTQVQGTVPTSVQGTVPTSVQGTVTTSVQGPVTTQLAPASQTFSVSMNSFQVHNVASLFGPGGTVYLTSVTKNNDSDNPTGVIIPRYNDSNCTSLTGVFIAVTVPAHDTINAVYPTPVQLTQPCASIVVSGSSGYITFTGYRE